MAIALRAAGASAGAASGNVTPGLPAGFQANDIHVLVVVAFDNVVVTLPAGWTKKFETNNGTTHRRTIAWKVAAGGDTGPLVTHAAGGNIIAQVFGYSGADSSGADPFDAAAQQSNASSITCTAPTITPGASTSMVLAVGSATGPDPVVWTVWSGTNPTFTERGDVTQGAGSIASLSEDDGTTTGAATGARTSTLDQSVVNIGTLLSLRVAGAGGTVAITGVAATGAVGTLAPSRTLAITGVAATGAVGTLAPSRTLAITGVAATGAVGTLAPRTSVTLTGVTATAAVGSVTVLSNDISLAVTGVSATSAAGSVVPNIAMPLGGNAAVSAVGSVTPSISLSVTGVSVAGAVGAVTPGAAVPLTGVSGTTAVGTITRTFFIQGVTKDSNGAPLGNCTVKLYNTSNDALVATTTSDASGNYSFQLAPGDTSAKYAVAYKAGATDVAGTTKNTLVGV